MFCRNRPATLLKKSLSHICFPVNFAKFLRTPFLQDTSGRLLTISFLSGFSIDAIFFGISGSSISINFFFSITDFSVRSTKLENASRNFAEITKFLHLLSLLIYLSTKCDVTETKHNRIKKLKKGHMRSSGNFSKMKK